MDGCSMLFHVVPLLRIDLAPNGLQQRCSHSDEDQAFRRARVSVLQVSCKTRLHVLSGTVRDL